MRALQRPILFIAILVFTGASACGPATAASSPSSQGQTAAVSTTDDPYTFQPSILTIPAGTTVTWTNTAGDQHTVTDDPSKAVNSADAALPAGAQAWDSGPLMHGQTHTHTFSAPGTYKYFCTIHESFGMLGTITVT
jgi:plastocyanin